ncbi:MAG: protoporphyrinogen oxidase HemJ [Janthinobacterium lividum]
MADFFSSYYLVLKSFHIIFVVCWMAALFYLPRLFAYHARVDPQSESSELFKIMERRLVRIIMTPSMLGTWIFGLCLLCVPGMLSSPFGWFHVKLLLVLIMTAFHGIAVKWMKDFSVGKNTKSETFYRAINEVPTLAFIFIVFLVVIKPF